jgi:hypothetical protein
MMDTVEFGVFRVSLTGFKEELSDVIITSLEKINRAIGEKAEGSFYLYDEILTKFGALLERKGDTLGDYIGLKNDVNSLELISDLKSINNIYTKIFTYQKILCDCNMEYSTEIYSSNLLYLSRAKTIESKFNSYKAELTLKKYKYLNEIQAFCIKIKVKHEELLEEMQDYYTIEDIEAQNLANISDTATTLREALLENVRKGETINYYQKELELP